MTTSKSLLLAAAAALVLGAAGCASEPGDGGALLTSQADELATTGPTYTAGTELVTTAALNLRSAGSTSASILRVMPNGSHVTVRVTSGANGWVAVRFSGYDGWAHTSYLVLASNGGGGGSSPGMLDTSIVSQIVEPEGGGKDDANNSFTDKNYWNFCMPGAATVALYYFLPTNVTAWPAGSFKEPSNAPSAIPAGGTYWDSKDKVNGYATYGRAYLMHLAEQVKPPSYAAPGMASFTSYPSTGANLTDLRDALNWEASGHASGWASFFYSIAKSSSMTQSSLHADIKKTIDGGHAVVAAADTGLLPNWSRSLSHAITVVGYDDTASTYKYTDTCGVHCNGSAKSKNGGVWTIAQVALYNAIKSDGAGYVK